MATISNTPRPGYVWDSTDNVWYPIGVGAHQHTNAADTPAVIPNALVDAKGDLLTATADNTPARLAVGSNDQVLTVDSSTATGLKWATPAGGGKILQVVTATTTTGTTLTTSYADVTGMTATITPTSSTSKIMLIWSSQAYSSCSSYDDAVPTVSFQPLRGSTVLAANQDALGTDSSGTGGNGRTLRNAFAFTYIDSPATTSATTYKIQGIRSSLGGTVSSQFFNRQTLTLFEIGA